MIMRRAGRPKRRGSSLTSLSDLPAMRTYMPLYACLVLDEDGRRFAPAGSICGLRDITSAA
jgi:hypothetical protein